MSGEAYSKRYVGGFVDDDASFPADAQFLNAVETALVRLLKQDPTDGRVMVWDSALGGFKTIQLSSTHLASNAAIAKSQLASFSIADADVAAGAAISVSKLAAGSSGQILKTSAGVPTWTDPTTYFRKTTPKVVNTTTSETDLINGEFTIAGNSIGTSGRVTLKARGDWKQNSGGATDIPRFKLKLGATTLIDSGVIGVNNAPNAASRVPWWIDVEIINLGATNSQYVKFSGMVQLPPTGTSSPSSTVGSVVGGTGYSYGPLVEVSSTNTTLLQRMEIYNTTSVDTTASCALVLSVINASANANYETKLHSAIAVIE